MQCHEMSAIVDFRSMQNKYGKKINMDAPSVRNQWLLLYCLDLINFLVYANNIPYSTVFKVFPAKAAILNSNRQKAPYSRVSYENTILFL